MVALHVAIIIMLWSFPARCVEELPIGLEEADILADAPAMYQRATFGAGCFWGTERYFKKEFGAQLHDAFVGYTGGSIDNPTYKQVCSGTTNHAEVLSFTFDPAATPYASLLSFFFRMHDPTTLNRQQGDRGTQYRSAVFYHTPEQKDLAERMILDFNTRGSALNQKLQKAFGPQATVVATVESGAGPIYRAEDYHQQYLDANPTGYCSHKIYMPAL